MRTSRLITVVSHAAKRIHFVAEHHHSGFEANCATGHYWFLWTATGPFQSPTFLPCFSKSDEPWRNPCISALLPHRLLWPATDYCCYYYYYYLALLLAGRCAIVSLWYIRKVSVFMFLMYLFFVFIPRQILLCSLNMLPWTILYSLDYFRVDACRCIECALLALDIVPLQWFGPTVWKDCGHFEFLLPSSDWFSLSMSKWCKFSK